MGQATSDVAPPRARIAFRVGVVGHRPARLPADGGSLAALRVRIGEALEAVVIAVAGFARGPERRHYRPDSPPALTAVSSLAEGADRIFAEEALRLGFSLNCVMPFHREEFERDFTGSCSFEDRSVARLDAILTRAKDAGALALFELDGRREREKEAYRHAATVVMNQSDLLLAIWDGGPASGPGGTFDTIQQAIACHVPALWIDSRDPNVWKLLQDESDLEAIINGTGRPPPASPVAAGLAAAIGEVVRAELGLEGGQAVRLESYLVEARPRLNLAMGWKVFRDLIGACRVRLPALRVRDFEAQVRRDWPVTGDPDTPPIPPVSSDTNARLRPHYAWSDKLADLYADAHRSCFVATSLLSASAVFTALLPAACHFGRRAAISTAIVEALILTLLAGLPMWSRRRQWHEKWLEYRVLAELVRELRILIPLGGARLRPRPAAHLGDYGDPARSWMNWQARAIARDVGLPTVRIDGAYMATRCSELLAFLGSHEHGQIGFHRMNCHRLESIHRRLHRISLILFVTTILAVAVNWGFRLVHPDAPEQVSDWLILFSAFLPALGAALAAINNQGEFARLHKRANAMAHSLARLKSQIAGLARSADGPSLSGLSVLAAQLGQMMIEENAEWRIVVLDLPHAAG